MTWSTLTAQPGPWGPLSKASYSKGAPNQAKNEGGPCIWGGGPKAMEQTPPENKYLSLNRDF